MAKRKPNPYHGWAAGSPERVAQAKSGIPDPRNTATSPGSFNYRPQAPAQTFDPDYERAKTDLGANRDNALAQATFGEGRAASDFGFQLNRDPTTGFATAGGLDTSNPFSKMSLLQRSYETSKRSTSNQYASMGQGFSGAFNAQQGENTRGYQQGYDALTKDFADILMGFTQDRANAQSSYTSGLADADLAKLLRLVQGGA